MTDALKFDGMDKAIVGFTAGATTVLVYDYEKLLDALAAQGMDFEEAQEWVGFNMVDAYMGDGTPIIMYLCAPEEALRSLE